MTVPKSHLPIILGSSSKTRASVLKKAGYEFEVISPDTPEDLTQDLTPEALALSIANDKLKDVLKKVHIRALVITSDQVVTCNNEIRGKPKSPNEAYQFIKSYNHYPAFTHTALVVYNTQNHKKAESVDTASVHFKSIPESVIDALAQKPESLHLAGGFQIEGEPLIAPYIKSINGTLDSIQGLPMKVLEQLLSEVVND